MSRYYKKYNLNWPKLDIINSAITAEYKQGCDSAGIHWPVDESRVPVTDWSTALSEFTNSPISNMFFSKVHWGGLPIHRDHNRLCALNFPIIGDFNGSMNIFVDDFDQRIEEFNGPAPCLMNTRQFHGVTNKTNTDRIVLSVSFYEPYRRILNRTFNNNEIFYV
jgi:aspartyl/asparaginyl beta-hydroxylase (cupin superfamily)